MGHGLPIATGIALGLQIQNISSRVFTVIGDGECNEGTIWESALLASHHQLDNLCCVVDYNHSTDRALLVGDLVDKFRSFGWNALSVNGHDQEALFQLLSDFPEKKGMPTVLVAETIKGYGVRSIENQAAWHHRSPTTEEMSLLIKEIYETA